VERVTPQNLMFLSAEGSAQRLHVGSVGVYEGPAPPLADLVDRVEQALPLVPRTRQKIQDVPLRLARPVWVDDVAFDVNHHLRHVVLSEPGDLESLVGRIASEPFAKDRPLWGMWQVTGLDGDRWALVTKTHQVMVDGIAGTPLLAVLLDLTPEGRPLPTVEWEPRDHPSDLRLVGDALSDLAIDPVEVGRALQAGLRVQGAALRWAVERVTSPSPPEDPTELSGPIGGDRHWRSVDLDLDAVRAVRASRSVPVNDVLLAVLTAGFRRLLSHRGALDETDVVRVAIPLSVGDGSRYENEITVVSYELPVGVDQPLERVAAIAAQTDELDLNGVAADVLRTLAGNPSPRLLAVGSRMAAMAVRHQTAFHSMAINVPGPESPRFLLGRRLVTSHPVVPLVDGVRIALGAVSMGDRIHVGLTGYPPYTEDLDVLAAGLRDGLDELVLAAAGRADS